MTFILTLLIVAFIFAIIFIFVKIQGQILTSKECVQIQEHIEKTLLENRLKYEQYYVGRNSSFRVDGKEFVESVEILLSSWYVIGIGYVPRWSPLHTKLNELSLTLSLK